MKEKQFIDGIRAYKAHPNAPDFVKAQFQVFRDELIEFLKKQPEKFRFDLKESQKGTYYCEKNDFQPKDTGASAGAPSGSGEFKQSDYPPDDFDSDLPF